MAREEVLAFLTGLVGPTGPFDSIEAVDSRWKSWLAGASDETVEDLLTLLRHPPTEMRAEMWEEMEQKIAESLGILGRRNPSRFLESAAPLLNDAQVRPTLLSALGLAKAREAVPVLAQLLERGGLTDKDLIRLAEALGAMGGTGAERLLGRLEVLAQDKPEVLQEAGVAREIIAYDRSSAALMGQAWNRAMKALGKGDKDTFLEHALPLLEQEEPRMAVLELLGAVHSIRGVAWLAEKGSLSPAELSLAARSLAEAGGAEARQALSGLLPIAAQSREALPAFEAALLATSQGHPSRQLETALIRTAESLEKMDRAAYWKEVFSLLEEPRSRSAWLTMVGVLQSAEGLSWLDEPLARAGAKDGELVQWIKALTGVGGAEARATLTRLQSSELVRAEPVRHELERALKLVEA